MMQHPLNLMPEAIRARAQAGQQLRRTVTICVSVLLLAGALTTWSRIRFEQAGTELVRLEALAERALSLESQTTECNDAAGAIEAAMDEYHEVALPVPVSSLMAGLVRALPEDATLDSVNLSYVDRDRLVGEDAASRKLQGQIAGFAVTDEAVATLARRLEGLAPFESVRLEGSRSRVVRGRSARGFTLVFSVDLDRPWMVRDTEQPPNSPSWALMKDQTMEGNLP